MNYYCFVFLYCFLFFYLFFFPRLVDVRFVSSLGLLVYFFPAIFPFFYVADQVYFLLILIFGFFVFFLFFSDLFYSSFGLRWQGRILLNESFRRFYFFLVFFLSVFFIYKVGGRNFFTGKIDGNISVFVYSFYVSVVSIGFVFSFFENKKWHFFFYFFLMFFVFLGGTRTHLVMSGFAILSLMGVRGFLAFRFLKLKYILFFVVFVLIGLIGKDVYASFSDDGLFYLNLISRLNGFDMYIILSRTEPYHTFSILNNIVAAHYAIDSSYINDLPYHFLPYATPFTDTLHFFSESVKERFYSTWGADAGVGGNYWGEGYALAGIQGVILYTILYCLVIFVLDFLSKNKGGYFKFAFSLMGVFWGFYIHRNSLFQIISHEKRTLYVFLSLMVFFVIGKYLFSILIKRSRF